MDLMVLDRDLNAIAVVDTYNSLIWTDRYQEYGDFELYMPMSIEVLSYIQKDNYLWNKESEHLMIIEQLLIESDVEDGAKITVTGRSLESILDRRVVWGLKTISGSLQNGIKALLDENIINPTDTNRKIPNFIFEASTDPEIVEMTVDTQYTGDNLYDVIQKLCFERGMGFKITVNESKQFVFKLYVGTDRSYSQSEYPYVVFSPNFENIISSNYVESKSGLKNVTLIGGEGEGIERRYTHIGNTSGLDRRELFTDARDISSDVDEDLTELFNFNQYQNQVFNDTTKQFVSDNRFNSCMVDISAYHGRILGLTIPQYTNRNGEASPYATVFVDASKRYISTVQKWERYTDSNERGTLTTYEFLLPDNVQYIYTSMFSQAAINGEIYSGDEEDFECKTVKLADYEYMALLEQRGREDLAENVETMSFDGQAETTVMFRYGEDFFTGDIVQIADEYGHETKARITEIIISENEEGYSAYPTFKTLTELAEEGAEF